QSILVFIMIRPPTKPTLFPYTTLFRSYEGAKRYVNNIYDFILNEDSYEYFRITKKEQANLGKYFVVYKANKRTSWLIFFLKNKNRILVTYITNNHTEEYARIY